MSYVRHEAILVSSWQAEAVQVARLLACDFDGLLATPIAECGETFTFAIVPEGSKAGRREADAARVDREKWKRLAREKFGDRSGLYIQWVHVAYPGIGDLQSASVIDEESTQ